MEVKYKFVHNGFVFQSENNYMTLQPTTFIIPYYAINKIEIDDNNIRVWLKNSLSAQDSFDKRIYRINDNNCFNLYFDDNNEKVKFIDNVKKYIEDEKLDIVFK